MGRKRFSREFEFVRNWDSLPDDAVIPTKIAAFFLGIDERTVRYHPALTRVQLSQGRYGFRCGDLRKLARGELRETVA
jgi:hypothetical protein